jgi:hypothetical protein
MGNNISECALVDVFQFLLMNFYFEVRLICLTLVSLVELVLTGFHLTYATLSFKVWSVLVLLNKLQRKMNSLCLHECSLFGPVISYSFQFLVKITCSKFSSFQKMKYKEIKIKRYFKYGTLFYSLVSTFYLGHITAFS